MAVKAKASENLKWIDLQRQSKEEVDNEQLELDNEQALNRTNNDIHNAKTVVSDKKKALNAAKRSASFSATAILNAERELAVAEKNVEDLTRIKGQMFSAE